MKELDETKKIIELIDNYFEQAEPVVLKNIMEQLNTTEEYQQLLTEKNLTKRKEYKSALAKELEQKEKLEKKVEEFSNIIYERIMELLNE